jgi:hypothetical protein
MSTVDGRRTAWRSVTVWTVATVTGIAVCWWGIRPVLDAVVPDRLVAFPAVSAASPASGVPAVAGSPVTGPAPSVGPVPSRSAAPHSPATPGPSSPADAGGPAGPAVIPSTVDGWTTLPDGGYARTFVLVGGTVTVEAAVGAMTLVSATPRTAYVMTVTPTASDRVVVSFTGLTLHVSTLDARWAAGAPTAKVTELP